MEQRLKNGGKEPAPQVSIPEHRAVAQQNSTSTLVADANAQKGGSRPGTAKASQQAVPGAPPTPTASEGEYEFVPDPYTTSFGAEYPRYRHQLLLPRLMASSSGGGGGAPGSGSAQELRSQHYHHQLYQHQSSPSHSLNYMNIFNKPPPAHDARSIKSVRTIGSENGSADFVIVPGPDGDGEQDH